MAYKFKKNQEVKYDFNMDYRDTGGPFIRKGTKAMVLKRCRGTNSVWVQSENFGIRRESATYLVAA